MPRQASNKKKIRVQLDFSELAHDELLGLRKKIRASSKAEVVRNGLGALRWIVRHLEQGHEIIAVDGATKKVYEPCFPFMEHLEKTPQS